MQATAIVKQSFLIPTARGFVEMPKGSTHTGHTNERGDFVFWLELPGGRLIEKRVRAGSGTIEIHERIP